MKIMSTTTENIVEAVENRVRELRSLKEEAKLAGRRGDEMFWEIMEIATFDAHARIGRVIAEEAGATTTCVSLHAHKDHKSLIAALND